jgi:NAD(P)H dehydrogenase (quinone)
MILDHRQSSQEEKTMNVLWVFAHPERSSLTAALRDEGIAALTEAGHEVMLSDLYAMKWNPIVDADNFTENSGERLHVAEASKRAYQSGTLSPDIRAEQEKLDRADAVVFQFPLWWFGMPAIMKGWVDRVFVKGYAYGIPDPDHPGRTLRYGHRMLSGKRALTVVTIGGPESTYGPRGINGQLDQVLFPLLHGTFWYVGIASVPPVAVYRSDKLSDEQFQDAARLVRERVLSIADTETIPYRYQNYGDYTDDLTVRPDLVPDVTGLAAHYSA